MLRILTAAAIVLIVTSATGCGGSSLEQAARRETKGFLGDPHPELTRVEAVQLVDGERVAVVQMKGNFLFVPDCPAPTPGSRSHCQSFRTHYAVKEFGLSDRSSSGYWSSSASEVNAIATAREASPLFGIFPDFINETVLCSIPRRGSGSAAGTCSTQIADGKWNGRIKQLEFVERWPLGRRSGSRVESGWMVTLGRSGRVVDVCVKGRTPPQLSGLTSVRRCAPTPLEVAHASREWFTIFPRMPGTIRCRFGGGVMWHLLHGSCTTAVRPRSGYSGQTQVAFVERWRMNGGAYRSGWIVTVGPTKRVLRVREIGSTPPQDWK